MPPVSKYLILTGIVLVALGLFIWVAGNRLHWFGHLPGDIRIERPNVTFYAPLTSMLLVSIFLSLLMWIIRRLF